MNIKFDFKGGRDRERKEKTVTYGLYVLYVMGKKGERKQDDCSNVCR